MGRCPRHLLHRRWKSADGLSHWPLLRASISGTQRDRPSDLREAGHTRWRDHGARQERRLKHRDLAIENGLLRGDLMAILDGEITVLDKNGVSSFGLIQPRIAVA